MPLIIDREVMKIKIMQALQRCAMNKPLTEVSLREVAAEAGISHSKVLYYFKNKNELLSACSLWAGDAFCNMIKKWFDGHKPSDYESKIEYFNCFFQYLIEDDTSGMLPRSVVMNCVLGDYNEELKKTVTIGNDSIRDAISVGLRDAFEGTISQMEIDVVLLLYNGIYLNNLNSMISGKYNSKIGTSLKKLIN